MYSLVKHVTEQDEVFETHRHNDTEHERVDHQEALVDTEHNRRCGIHHQEVSKVHVMSETELFL